jgi:hypothetical protein
MAAARERTFELRVLPRGDRSYGLALFQARPGRGSGREPEFTPVVRIWGDPLRVVLDQVLAFVKKAGYGASQLSRARREPFRLREEDGVRLGLLFLGIKPLRRLGRVEGIAEHVRGMEPEEAYYWYSKATAGETARRGQRAFRILMAQE